MRERRRRDWQDGPPPEAYAAPRRSDEKRAPAAGSAWLRFRLRLVYAVLRLLSPSSER